MNGYELADLLEEDMEEGFGLGFLNDAVNMLRQQADRITELEKQLSLHKNAHHKAVEILQEQTKSQADIEFEADRLYWRNRTLTDDEIMEIFTAYEQMQEYGYVGKKPFQVSLGWSLSERNDCLMLARTIEKRMLNK